MFQSRYRLTNRWTVNGHYTLQLQNDGNYEGEGTNTPGSNSSRHRRLSGGVRRDARTFPRAACRTSSATGCALWSIYNWQLGRFGDLSVSGLVARRLGPRLQPGGEEPVPLDRDAD